MYVQLNDYRIGLKSKVKRFKDPLDGQALTTFNQLWPKINEKNNFDNDLPIGSSDII